MQLRRGRQTVEFHTQEERHEAAQDFSNIDSCGVGEGEERARESSGDEHRRNQTKQFQQAWQDKIHRDRRAQPRS